MDRAQLEHERLGFLSTPGRAPTERLGPPAHERSRLAPSGFLNHASLLELLIHQSINPPIHRLRHPRGPVKALGEIAAAHVSRSIQSVIAPLHQARIRLLTISAASKRVKYMFAKLSSGSAGKTDTETRRAPWQELK